jgi:hypothetical protein
VKTIVQLTYLRSSVLKSWSPVLDEPVELEGPVFQVAGFAQSDQELRSDDADDWPVEREPDCCVVPLNEPLLAPDEVDEEFPPDMLSPSRCMPDVIQLIPAAVIQNGAVIMLVTAWLILPVLPLSPW